MTRVKIRRGYIVSELTRELYHNPAILEICNDDDIVVDEDRFSELCHDLGVIFGRVIESASRTDG